MVKKKLNNSNGDKTPIKNQMVTKLENSNCDNTQIVTKLKKTQNLTKLNFLQNSNCDKTKKKSILTQIEL